MDTLDKIRLENNDCTRQKSYDNTYCKKMIELILGDLGMYREDL